MEIKSSKESARIYTEGMLQNREKLHSVKEQMDLTEKNFNMGREIYETMGQIVTGYGKIVGRDAMNIMRIANSLEEQDEEVALSMKNI